MIEFRCKKCKKLFFKGLMNSGVIEIKCSRCSTLYRISTKDYQEDCEIDIK